MTRKELIALVAEQAKMTKSEVERVFHATFDKVMPEAFAEGTIISINDFGKFEPVFKAAHTGRNPATGLPCEVADKMSLKFKAATKLKDTMN